MTAPPAPVTTPPVAPVGTPPRRRVTPIALAVVAVLILVGVCVGLAVSLTTEGGTEAGGGGADARGVTDAGGAGGGGGAGAASEGETGGSPVDGAPPPAQEIRPVAATATAVRDSVNLRCGNQHVTYGPQELIDGDVNTGWGAGANDGTGQSITVELGGTFRLTEIGLSPGYLKIGPRADTDCQPVEAFPRNRYIPRVEYRFDDGSTVVHDLPRVAAIQTLAVDVVTSTVTITILETVLPPGADDDTILSEATFAGTPA